MDAPWRESVNMENLLQTGGETVQVAWTNLLTEALKRKHYLATKALLRLTKKLYGHGERNGISSELFNNNNNVDSITTTTTTTANHQVLYLRNRDLTRSERQNVNKADNENPYMRSIKESMMSYLTVLAVKTNNVKFIRLMLSHGFDIQWPHLLECRCWLCESDKLGQAKGRIETMQALSNPLWIHLTCKDPFLTSFRITKTCRQFRSQQDCFEKEYEQIAKTNMHFCTGLLDKIQDEMEVRNLMKWREKNFEPFKDVHDLAFIRLGFKYEVKEVVAHAVPQHVIMNIVSEGIPRWKSGGILYRLVFISLVAVFYPFTAVVRICAPDSYVGRMAAKPLIKFINGVASFVTLLVLLAHMSTQPKSGIRIGNKPSVVELLIFIWIFSLFCQEVKQMQNMGKNQYFGSGWNWIDINMIGLVFVSYSMWVIMYFVNPQHKDETYTFILSFPESFFSVAIILSFFRMVCLCQITRYLGLLQLCLGRMLQVLFQFAFISIVILCSFSVGLVFLFHSSKKYNEMTMEMSDKKQNGTFVDQMLTGRYNGLPATIVTLAWASINMIGLKSLDGLDDGTMVHLWSYLMFTLYHGISMIVMLNMLIAMMSNSYQQMENNIDIEHKYARTNLWLEYLGDSNTIPCPFNLLPTMTFMKKLLRRVEVAIKNESNTRSCEEEAAMCYQREQYTQLCKKLMQRYLQEKYNIYGDEDFPSDDSATTVATEDDAFLAMVKEKIKTWSLLLSKQQSEVNQERPKKVSAIDDPFTDVDGGIL